MSQHNTVKELRQIAGYLDISGRSKMNKKQLVKAVQKSQQGGGKHYRNQRGGVVNGAPYFYAYFGSPQQTPAYNVNQTGGNPTPMPMEWYHPSTGQTGGGGRFD